MDKFEKGSRFISEKTGSATKINLDGEWEHDFVDDNTTAGKKTRVKPKEQLKHHDNLNNKTS